MPTITKALAIGLICLFVAFSFPAFIDSSGNTHLTEEVILEGNGSSETVGEALVISVDNKTTSTVTLSVSGLQFNNTTQVTLSETESKSISLEGDSVTITALDIASPEKGDITLEVTYPREFEWERGTRKISQNLPIVFATLGFILVGGLIAMGVKQ